MTSLKRYTVFNLADVEHTEEAPHEVFTHPHDPRQCLANLKGIATGVDFNIAGQELLTQEEAEARMATEEWTVAGTKTWIVDFKGVTDKNYIGIPEWNPAGDYIVKMTLRGSGMAFSNNNKNPYLWVKPDGAVQFRGLVDHDSPAGTVNPTVHTRLELHRRGEELFLVLDGEEISIGSSTTGSDGISRLGETFGSATAWTGDIYDVELLDMEDETNHRLYSCKIITTAEEGHVRPTTDVIPCTNVEHDHDGQLQSMVGNSWREWGRYEENDVTSVALKATCNHGAIDPASAHWGGITVTPEGTNAVKGGSANWCAISLGGGVMPVGSYRLSCEIDGTTNLYAGGVSFNNISGSINQEFTTTSEAHIELNDETNNLSISNIKLFKLN